MPVPAALEGAPAIVGPLGGLLLSSVRAGSPMLVVRAVRWWRDLARLGVSVPLFVVHDFGLLLAVPREQIQIAPRDGCDLAVAAVPALAELVASYRGLIAEIGQGEATWCGSALSLGDELVVVALARVLGSLLQGSASAAKWAATLPLDPELVRGLDAQLPRLFAAAPREHEAAVLGALSRARLRLLTLMDALDFDTLRLLRMLGPESGAAGALAHVDLLAALSSPAANDIVNFSLELLPKVLETHRARSTGTRAVKGYRGVGRRGSVDSMVLTELAWESDELARRLLDGEILFYTREQAPQEARRLHYLVVDASASMRGDREVFARGLAIALAKKVELEDEEVWMRFFDSRLYDVQRAHDRSKLPVAWLLGFKGERGRNPARVFAQLATELALLRARDPREPVVHVITHGALHVPRPLVMEVRKRAHLFGVFILPSEGRLELDWLDLLEGHAVVDYATLQQKGARAAAATRIVDEATRIATSG